MIKERNTYSRKNKEALPIIKSVRLEHKGGIYIYRLHTPKVDKLCANGLGNLKTFLNDVFDKCPNHYFNGGPRGSALKFRLPVDLISIPGHDIATYARNGLEVNKERFKHAHPQVQSYLIENDPTTVAMEVPLWMEQHEMKEFVDLFGTIEPLTGHIDILRVENDYVWVWDYKPNAEKEKYAATQVYFYAYMLSKRTHIPITQFRCGYFDDNHTYAFKPGDITLNKNVSLTEY